jgi:hypothetical protein
MESVTRLMALDVKKAMMFARGGAFPVPAPT